MTFYLTPKPTESTGSLGKVSQMQLELRRQFNKPEYLHSGDTSRQEEQLSFA